MVHAGGETPKKAKKPRAKKPDNRTAAQKAQASTTSKAEPKAKKQSVKDRARVTKNKGKPVRKPKPVTPLLWSSELSWLMSVGFGLLWLIIAGNNAYSLWQAHQQQTSTSLTLFIGGMFGAMAVISLPAM